MKADHRKELKTNALRHGMEQFFTKAKSGSGLLWGGLLLIVVLCVAYWLWTGRTANRVTDAWTGYWNNRDSSFGLEEVAPRLKGTAAQKAADLARADKLYSEGLDALLTKSPKLAHDNFTQASELYADLSKRATDPIMGLRATLGAARAQESLGEIERAKWFYQDAVDRFAKPLRNSSGMPHPLIADAEKRLKLLDDETGLAFYQGKDGEGKRWPHRLPAIEHKPSKSGTPPAGSPLERPSPLGGP